MKKLSKSLNTICIGNMCLKDHSYKTAKNQVYKLTFSPVLFHDHTPIYTCANSETLSYLTYDLHPAITLLAIAKS